MWVTYFDTCQELIKAVKVFVESEGVELDLR